MEKYNVLLPLAGIILGWLLNELSGVLQRSSEDVRIIKSTITSLLIVRGYEINHIRSIQMAAKHATKFKLDLAEMENRRLDNNELILISSMEINEILTKIMDNLSYIDPILTYETSNCIDASRLIDKIKMNEISKDEAKYIESILTIETTLELGVVATDKLILKLAKKVGIREYFSIKRHLDKIAYDKKYSVIDFIEPDKMINYVKNHKEK